MLRPIRLKFGSLVQFVILISNLLRDLQKSILNRQKWRHQFPNMENKRNCCNSKLLRHIKLKFGSLVQFVMLVYKLSTEFAKICYQRSKVTSRWWKQTNHDDIIDWSNQLTFEKAWDKYMRCFILITPYVVLFLWCFFDVVVFLF